MIPVIVGVAALVVGATVGFLVRANMAKSSANTLEAQARQQVIAAEQKVLEANQEAATVLRKANEDAKADAAQVRREAEEDVKSRRDEIARLERRILESEEGPRTDPQVGYPQRELDQRDEMLHDARLRLSRPPISTASSSNGSPA
jgi:ribonuclease Y